MCNIILSFVTRRTLSNHDEKRKNKRCCNFEECAHDMDCKYLELRISRSVHAMTDSYLIQVNLAMRTFIGPEYDQSS